MLKRGFGRLKRSIFIAISVFFSLNSYAQTSFTLSPEVHSYYKDSLIEISYQYGNCNLVYEGFNKDEVYLKIKNLTNKEVEVSWELALTYTNKCYNCHGESDELKFKTVIQPNQTLQGRCGEDGNPYLLKIFSGFVNNESEVKLKKFDIKNITAKIQSKQ